MARALVIDVRRGAERFHTTAPGLDSWSSFSYGPHYDPDNLGFGALMAHNEDRLSPGAGFDSHPHRGLDIVTWVLSGNLDHEHWIDGHGEPPPPARRERLGPGSVQVLRSGSGVRHAEHAAADSAGVHYVQMWLAPAAPAAAPEYERRDFTAALAQTATTGRGEMITVAAGPDEPSADGIVRLTRPGVVLSVGRLPAGTQLDLPASPLVHAFVAGGVLTADDGIRLTAGDAVRLSNPFALALTVVEASEVLVWTLPST